MKRLGLAFAMLAVLFVLMPGASATGGDPHKVTLCHRTHSETNAYVSITVDVASVKFEGHDGHDGPVWYPGAKADGVRWGDIIPAFSIEDGYPFDYLGKNVPEGQTILDDGCQVEQPSPSPSKSTSTPPPSSSSTTTTPPATSTSSPRGVPDPHPDSSIPSTALTGGGSAPLIFGGIGLGLLFIGSLILRLTRRTG